MTRKQLLAIGASVLIGAGLLAAQAPMHRHFGNGHGLQMMATALDLTDAQKAQAKTIFDDARAQAQPVVEQLKKGHDAMEAAVKAGNNAAIDSVAASQGVLMGQTAAIHAKAFSKLYAILTPEQKTKADQLHGQLRGAFQRRFHRGESAPQQ